MMVDRLMTLGRLVPTGAIGLLGLAVLAASGWLLTQVADELPERTRLEALELSFGEPPEQTLSGALDPSQTAEDPIILGHEVLMQPEGGDTARRHVAVMREGGAIVAYDIAPDRLVGYEPRDGVYTDTSRLAIPEGQSTLCIGDSVWAAERAGGTLTLRSQTQDPSQAIEAVLSLDNMELRRGGEDTERQTEDRWERLEALFDSWRGRLLGDLTLTFRIGGAAGPDQLQAAADNRVIPHAGLPRDAARLTLRSEDLGDGWQAYLSRAYLNQVLHGMVGDWVLVAGREPAALCAHGHRHDVEARPIVLVDTNVDADDDADIDANDDADIDANDDADIDADEDAGDVVVQVERLVIGRTIYNVSVPDDTHGTVVLTPVSRRAWITPAEHVLVNHDRIRQTASELDKTVRAHGLLYATGLAGGVWVVCMLVLWLPRAFFRGGSKPGPQHIFCIALAGGALYATSGFEPRTSAALALVGAGAGMLVPALWQVARELWRFLRFIGLWPMILAALGGGILWFPPGPLWLKGAALVLVVVCLRLILPALLQTIRVAWRFLGFYGLLALFGLALGIGILFLVPGFTLVALPFVVLGGVMLVRPLFQVLLLMLAAGTFRSALPHFLVMGIFAGGVWVVGGILPNPDITPTEMTLAGCWLALAAPCFTARVPARAAMFWVLVLAVAGFGAAAGLRLVLLEPTDAYGKLFHHHLLALTAIGIVAAGILNIRTDRGLQWATQFALPGRISRRIILLGFVPALIFPAMTLVGDETGFFGIFQPSEIAKSLLVALVAVTVTRDLAKRKMLSAAEGALTLTLVVVAGAYASVILATSAMNYDMSPIIVSGLAMGCTLVAGLGLVIQTLWRRNKQRRYQGLPVVRSTRLSWNIPADSTWPIISRQSKFMYSLWPAILLLIVSMVMAALCLAFFSDPSFREHGDFESVSALLTPWKRIQSWYDLGLLNTDILIHFPETGSQLRSGREALLAAPCQWVPAFCPNGLAATASSASIDSLLKVPAVQDDFAPASLIHALGVDGALLYAVAQVLLLGVAVGIGWSALSQAGERRIVGWMVGCAVFGMATLYFAQIAVAWANILGILPIMGQPMTFVSFGGSHHLAVALPLVAVTLLASSLDAGPAKASQAVFSELLRQRQVA